MNVFMKKILLSVCFINLTQASQVDLTQADHLFTFENATDIPLNLQVNATFKDQGGQLQYGYPFELNPTSEPDSTHGPGIISPGAIYIATKADLKNDYYRNSNYYNFSLYFKLLLDSKEYSGELSYQLSGAKIKLSKDNESNTYLVKIQDPLVNVYKILPHENSSTWKTEVFFGSLKDLAANVIQRNKQRFDATSLSQQLPQDVLAEYFGN
ncbi:MAG: hypothetical protein K0M45_04415 [Candidatus Paracaedibacteraceae bacterium]|nr:hypothetical protein [Candidatus Paracaedibacteraceae bacterium]